MCFWNIKAWKHFLIDTQNKSVNLKVSITEVSQCLMKMNNKKKGQIIVTNKYVLMTNPDQLYALISAHCEHIWYNYSHKTNIL